MLMREHVAHIVYMCVHMYMCIHLYTHVSTLAFMCACVYMLCMCVRGCLHITIFSKG